MSKYFPIIRAACLLLAGNEVLLAGSAPAQPAAGPAADRYVAFIRQKHPAPADYVLQLFQKYDMVVICERMHPESTQWELIYDIVKDKRFRETVGHMFTEYGTIKLQPFLDSFMNAENLPESAVNSRVIYILRNLTLHPVWDNTNFYRFLKRLYALNQSLRPSERVLLHFSDVPFSWKDMTAVKYKICMLPMVRRDKTMADHIAVQFRKIQESEGPRDKCLVIMNYRHAFGPIRDGGGNLRGNTAEYLFEAFPGKVANVLLNTVNSDASEKPFLVHGGRWDAAFKTAGNPAVGFDLAGSPFGNDAFDMFPYLPWIEGKYKYQDVFTGFVFLNPVEEHVIEHGALGFYDGFEEEALRRAACISEQAHAGMKRRIEAWRKTPVQKWKPWVKLQTQAK